MFSRTQDGNSKSLKEFLEDNKSDASGGASDRTGAKPGNGHSTSSSAPPTKANSSAKPAPPQPQREASVPRSANAQRTREMETRTATRKDGVSVIGRDLAILGNDLKIVTRGKIQIDGQVRGDVYGDEIIVGDHGQVSGTIGAAHVLIRGTVSGAVHGREVVLASTAHVQADVHHAALKLEQGAVFEGRSRRPQNGEGLVPDFDRLLAETNETPGANRGPAPVRSRMPIAAE